MLLFWLSEFNSILRQIQFPDSTKANSLNGFPQDRLYATLIRAVGENRFAISDEILISPELSREEKDFLLIALGYFIGRNYEKQADINAAATQFIEDYPESPFRNRVEHTYLQVFYPTKISFSLSAFLGDNSLNDELAKKFRNGIAFGFSGGIYFKKVMLRTALSFAVTSPRRDILIADEVWEKDHTSSMTQFEASLGYVFFDYNRFSLIPFAGIGTTSFSPFKTSNEDEERLENVAFKAKFTQFVGLGMRFNLQKKDRATVYDQFEDKQYGYFLIQYRLANPFLDRSYEDMSGTTNLISLSFGGLFQPLRKR